MHNKGEWLVVPVIVFFSFAIDILSAVGLGIALSTFVFVGTFYRTGVVKFLSNGKDVICSLSTYKYVIFSILYTNLNSM